MPDVWTHCNSALNRSLVHVEERATGRWRHVKNFESAKGLHQWLTSLDIDGRIGTLVINCHGRFGGQVVLDRCLTKDDDDDLFRQWFEPLQRYIKDDGHLWFTGCAMANLVDGTRLLKKISAQLPGRVIIAHDRQSNNPNSAIGYAAGNITIQDLIEITDASQASQLEQRVHEWHPSCKWVRNRMVIRYPRDEQKDREGMRCAYPSCPGHSEATHQCDGSWNPGCQWRADVTIRSPYIRTQTRQAMLNRGAHYGKRPSLGGMFAQQGPAGLDGFA